jgi:hypothetical protein
MMQQTRVIMLREPYDSALPPGRHWRERSSLRLIARSRYIKCAHAAKKTHSSGENRKRRLMGLTPTLANFYDNSRRFPLGDQKGMRCGEIFPIPRLPPQL